MRRISHSSCRLHLSRAVRSSNTIGAVTQSETPDLGKCEPAQGLAMRAKPIRQLVTSRVEAEPRRRHIDRNLQKSSCGAEKRPEA